MSTSGNGKPDEKPIPLPPIVGEVAVEDGMTARRLAAVLKQSPYMVVADLIEAGVLATLDYKIPFDLITKVARKHGYRTKKIG